MADQVQSINMMWRTRNCTNGHWSPLPIGQLSPKFVGIPPRKVPKTSNQLRKATSKRKHKQVSYATYPYRWFLFYHVIKKGNMSTLAQCLIMWFVIFLTWYTPLFYLLLEGEHNVRTRLTPTCMSSTYESIFMHFFDTYFVPNSTRWEDWGNDTKTTK